MHCYNHPEKEAVGICKHCHKGLCTECLTDLEHGLACKDVHEDAVNELNAIIGISARTLEKGKVSRFASPVFFIFFGAVMLSFGSFFYKTDYMLITLGTGFLVFGLFIFFQNRRILRSNQ